METYGDFNNAAVYVIDKEFRIQYFNDMTRRAFPYLRCGDYCYRGLCNEETVCGSCPVLFRGKSDGMFYSRVQGVFVAVNCAEIEWPGCGVCTLVMSQPIEEGNRNLLFNLTNISAYDELYELNLTRGTYRILYYQDSEYVLPSESGTLDELEQVIYNRLLFPEDKHAFYALWNPLLCEEPSRLHMTEQAVKGQFRRLKASGEYCWCEQIIVPLNRKETQDVIVMSFLQDIQEQRRKEELRVDLLTGLYVREAFFREAEQFLASRAMEQYCLMAIDIEHFKLFNEWFGPEEGDRFLKNIAGYLKAMQDEGLGVAGYMGGDDFCIILSREPAVISRLQEQVMREVGQYGGDAGFMPAFGLYAIEPGDEVPINAIYDRAAIATAAVKGNYARRSCWYDNRMKEAIEEDHILLAEVQKALAEEQFLFYLQPQCNMSTGKVIGFESLVRWKHPERGMIPPGEFIPLLEKNGFIANLDRYVWDKVFAQIRRWLDRGLKPVPISVNVSRVDLYTMDVVECFRELLVRYELDPCYVEIEITESAYVEEYQLIAGVVENLQKTGFIVFMDDFGSGYSSLNMLKDINVDVIKLDIKFLNMNEQSVGRGLGILDAITSMARFMGLQLVAEGVETREQVKFLTDMGCLCGQGYYFYRPMPVEACEGLLLDENNLDFSGIKAQHMERLKVKELLNENTFSEAMINNILGGIGIYDVSDGRIALIQVNEQYCRLLGMDPVRLGEHADILEHLMEEDWDKLIDAFKNARFDPLYGTETDVRFLREDGAILWLHIRIFFMREQDGHLLYYGAVSDITTQKQWEQQIEQSRRALSSMVAITEQNESYQQLDEQTQRDGGVLLAQVNSGGLYGSYLEDGYPLYFVNDAMINLLGYEDYTEFADAVGGSLLNLIHASDRRQVLKALGSEYHAGYEYTTSYRIWTESGNYIWVLDKSRVVQAEDGRLAVLSACMDISEPILIQRQLSEWNERLLRQNQTLQFLNNDIPGGYYRCEAAPEMKFIHISGRFLEIFGYNRSQIRELFDDNCMNMIHPDDRKAVAETMTLFSNHTKGYNLEYRMMSRVGYISIIAQCQFIQSGNRKYLQCIVLDMTETVELRNQMTMLAEYMPENIVLITYKGDRCQYRILADGLFRHLGYTQEVYEEWLTGGKYNSTIEREEYSCIDERVRAEFMARRDYQGVSEIHYPDGKSLWVNLNARYIRESAEGIVYLCIYGDVSEIKKKEVELKLLSEQMEAMLRQAGINSWEWDIERHVLKLNSVIGKNIVVGDHPLRAGHVTVIENFPKILETSAALKSQYRNLFIDYVKRLYDNRSRQSISSEIPLRLSEGSALWVHAVGETLCDESGQPVRAVGYFVDITDRREELLESDRNRRALKLLRRQEEVLTRMAQRDPLTGLYNRRAAMPMIREYLEMAGEEPAALIIFDLDNFKMINDIWGHLYGDKMIVRNAKKLNRFFREDDIVCRIGGDEFMVLCKNILETDLAERLRQVTATMRTSIDIEGRALEFSVSAGYAMSPRDSRELGELYRRADMALFSAKAAGKSKFRAYAPEMREVREEMAYSQDECWT